jgi:hypothetical protein
MEEIIALVSIASNGLLNPQNYLLLESFPRNLRSIAILIILGRNILQVRPSLQSSPTVDKSTLNTLDLGQSIADTIGGVQVNAGTKVGVRTGLVLVQGARTNTGPSYGRLVGNGRREEREERRVMRNKEEGRQEKVRHLTCTWIGERFSQLGARVQITGAVNQLIYQWMASIEYIVWRATS